jgi:hypothetical protein
MQYRIEVYSMNATIKLIYELILLMYNSKQEAISIEIN